jgi:hypothetical protein
MVMLSGHPRQSAFAGKSIKEYADEYRASGVLPKQISHLYCIIELIRYTESVERLRSGSLDASLRERVFPGCQAEDAVVAKPDALHG